VDLGPWNIVGGRGGQEGCCLRGERFFVWDEEREKSKDGNLFVLQKGESGDVEGDLGGKEKSGGGRDVGEGRVF